MVLTEQQGMIRGFGGVFVYPNNDPYHFVLQAAMASSWGFERGFSFNGPGWSVSVEVLCYALFFLVCLLDLRRWWQLLLLVAAGVFLKNHGLANAGRGIFLFFLGGILFRIHSSLARRNPSLMALGLLTALTVTFWVLIPPRWETLLLRLHSSLPELMERIGLQGWNGTTLLLQCGSTFIYDLVLFPLILLCVTFWEAHLGPQARKLEWLGHLSYSSYLLHFPLQMAFLAAAAWLSLDSSFFSSTPALLIFLFLLIVLCVGSYQLFERPCQSWIRKWAGIAPPRK